MNTYFVDLHIHIGRTKSGRPVKISGSNHLTLTSILEEASQRKGMDVIGVIDCHVPEVLEELEELIHQGDAVEIEGGGIRFHNTLLILGTEMELNDEQGLGPFHVLVYLPTLYAMRQWSRWMELHQKNITLSSQRVYVSSREVQEKAKEFGGLFIPAHIFTPFKSIYGKSVKNYMAELLDIEKIDAVELGLSSDTFMADQIPELQNFNYLTNSDAHSLSKIGREYQMIQMKEASFENLRNAIHNKEGQKIIANYGLDPKLGKYHKEVVQRISQLAEKQSNSKYEQEKENKVRQRPPYIHQVPLEFIPKLGKKGVDRLIHFFGSEMKAIHSSSREELEQVVTKEVADLIIKARNGESVLIPGGEGKFGKMSYGD